MKRLVIIAAAVLVPFALLVAWGLSALQHEPPPPPPIAEAPIAAPVALPSAAARPEAASPAPVVPPPPAVEPAAVVAVVPVAPRLDAAAQLAPVIEQCFSDLSPAQRRQARVNASFTARDDGTVTDVRVKARSGDPYLTACVQDALEAAHLEGVPAGRLIQSFGAQ